MGALNTYGAGILAGEGIDDMRVGHAMNRRKLQSMEQELQWAKDMEEITKAAYAREAARQAQKRMAAAKPVAAPTAPVPAAVAGGAGVMNAPVPDAGPGDSPEMGTNYGVLHLADGGMVNMAGAKDPGGQAIFDDRVWDGTFKGLPRLSKSRVHHMTGIHPDEPDFHHQLAYGVRMANGGMAGAPPFPGFNNGGAVGVAGLSLAMADGGFVPRAGMDAQAQADMMTRPGGALNAPSNASASPGGMSQSQFGNGGTKEDRLRDDAMKKRKLEEMLRNRKADGGALEAEGGHVSGPGTGTSDSIPAMLSDGEFVIPADVVKVIGTGPFQQLIDKYHKQVA